MEKVDGWRIVAVKDGHHVQLVSRTGKDHAARFPDVAQTVAGLWARSAVLDGEMVVFDEQLISRFHFLNDAPPDGQTVTPPTFIAFDLIQVGARDLRARPGSRGRAGAWAYCPVAKIVEAAERRGRSESRTTGPTESRREGPGRPAGSTAFPLVTSAGGSARGGGRRPRLSGTSSPRAV